MIDLNFVKNNLEKRDYKVTICNNTVEVIQLITNEVEIGSSIGYGGSVTLDSIKFFECFKSPQYVIENRYEPKLSDEEKLAMQQRMLCADYYFSSVNAMSIYGDLVNIDYHGNRVAAIMYGPKKVILVVGRNKICNTLEEAKYRAQHTASPLNAVRVKNRFSPPCIDIGKCIDCSSQESICNCYTVNTRSVPSGRIHIVLVDEELGY